MAQITIRDCDPGLIATARQKAKDAGTDLAAVLRAYLAAYAEDRTASQAGGRARAEALSATQRRAIAQRAAEARWRHRTSD